MADKLISYGGMPLRESLAIDEEYRKAAEPFLDPDNPLKGIKEPCHLHCYEVYQNPHTGIIKCARCMLPCDTEGE